MTDPPPIPAWHREDIKILPAPETIRHMALEELDFIEAHVRHNLENPPPMLDGDNIVYGQEGKPIPDQEFMRDQERLLAEIRSERAKIPGTADSGDGRDGDGTA